MLTRAGRHREGIPNRAADWHIPGYTELRTLGSGRSGDVALARHDQSGRLVAIKYLRPSLLSDAGFTRMFPAEAAILASVDDPRVVRLYEYVESRPGAAVVYELVEGVSLRDILAHRGVTTAESALVVLRDCLLGLAAVHRHGVAHRALRPENLLIDGEGEGRLTDFGIAIRAGSAASPAGDVYAATAMFYECLAGRPCPAGPVPLEPVPGPLRPLVTAGLAADPRDRPANGSAFLAELTATAAAAYGLDWQWRGRSHLGEAALLLGARWPSSGALPAVQDGGGPRRRRITRWRALIAVGVVAVGVAGAVGAALAISGSGAGRAAGSVAAAMQRVSLQPSALQAPESAGSASSPSSSLSPSPAGAGTSRSSTPPAGSSPRSKPSRSPSPSASASASPSPSPSGSPSSSPSLTPHPPPTQPGPPQPTPTQLPP